MTRRKFYNLNFDTVSDNNSVHASEYVEFLRASNRRTHKTATTDFLAANTPIIRSGNITKPNEIKYIIFE